MHDKMIDGFYRYSYWKNLQVSREKEHFLANLFLLSEEKLYNRDFVESIFFSKYI